MQLNFLLFNVIRAQFIKAVGYISTSSPCFISFNFVIIEVFPAPSKPINNITKIKYIKKYKILLI